MADRKINTRLAESLGMPDDERAILWPQEWLKSADEATRKRAAMLLDVFTSKHPLDVLDKAQEDELLNYSAGLALIWLGKRGLRHVSRMLHSPNPRFRSNALDLLGYYRTHYHQRRVGYARMRSNLSEFIPEIVDVARHDPDAQLRLEAIRTLRDIGDKQAVEPLLEATHDPAQEVRLEAIYALGGIADRSVIEPLFAFLDDPQPKVHSTAVAAIGQLAQMRSQYFPNAQLNTQGAKETRALGESVSKKAIEPLTNMLADPNVRVQECVIEALAATGDKRAVEPLSKMLDTSEKLQDDILRALGELGAPRAVEPLLAILADKTVDKRKRAWAADYLVNVGGKDVPDSLLATLRYGDDVGRGAVMDALKYGSFRDKRLTKLLLNIAQDSNQSVSLRKEAIATLGELGRHGMRSEEAVDFLLLALWHEELRWEASTALDNMHNRRAVEPLIHLFSSTDEPSLRWRAANSLGRLGDSRALEPLLGMLKDEEVDQRLCAIYALGQIGDEHALPALEEISKHDIGITASGFEARYEAARAIRKIQRRKRKRTT